MPNDIRRAKMSRILYMIPPAFDSVQEVIEYISDAMDLCRDKYEKLAAVDAIGQVMEDYGYVPAN
ncbi:MAG: hypothetical protein JG777_800 [Clostridia bacterium]|jgi:hypothetical protein|nr:hypothetical protein [Clostridia bacterium]